MVGRPNSNVTLVNKFVKKVRQKDLKISTNTKMKYLNKIFLVNNNSCFTKKANIK